MSTETKETELAELRNQFEELQRVATFQERTMGEMELQLVEQEAQINDQARTIAEHLKTIERYESELQALRAQLASESIPQDEPEIADPGFNLFGLIRRSRE